MTKALKFTTGQIVVIKLDLDVNLNNNLISAINLSMSIFIKTVNDYKF